MRAVVLDDKRRSLRVVSDWPEPEPGPGEVLVQVVFETSGAPTALAEAVDRAAYGGLVVLIGQHSRPVPFVTQLVVQRQLTLMGSLIYEHPGDFAEVTGGPGPGRRAGRVLRACYPMAEAEAAFRGAAEVPGKTWIRVGPQPAVPEA